AIKLNPNFAEAYNARGVALDTKGKFDEAIADFGQAIKLDPKNARAFNNRGFAWRNRGDLDKAIADYNQALTLNAGYALALYNRGIAYYDKRDFEHATRDMNQAIKLNPNFSAAFMDRGIVLYDKHDYDRSLLAADASIVPKAGYAVSFGGRGASYENRREGDRIIQEASAPVRNTQYNAFAYSPDTFPPASPALIASAQAEVPRQAAPVPVAAHTPVSAADHHETQARLRAVPEKPKAAAHETAAARPVRRGPVPMPPHRLQRQPQRATLPRHPRISEKKPVVIPRRAALSRASAAQREPFGSVFGR